MRKWLHFFRGENPSQIIRKWLHLFRRENPGRMSLYSFAFLVFIFLNLRLLCKSLQNICMGFLIRQWELKTSRKISDLHYFVLYITVHFGSIFIDFLSWLEGNTETNRLLQDINPFGWRYVILWPQCQFLCISLYKPSVCLSHLWRSGNTCVPWSTLATEANVPVEPEWCPSTWHFNPQNCCSPSLISKLTLKTLPPTICHRVKRTQKWIKQSNGLLFSDL